MSIRRLVTLVTAVVVVGLSSESSSAQPLGAFRWQLQPYCNVVTLTVVQQGAQYQLDGTDDQCGADQQAGVTGLAFLNPDGSIGFGLNIVTAPGGVPVHVDATIALASLGGTWRDSAGATGSFVLTPGASSGGSPRPPGGIGLSAIDPTQIQSRVTGVCPAGELMTGVNQDGSVTCGAVAGGGGGDITGVAAGVGLLGGGTAGDVALTVNFAGTGAAPAAAHSDHTHAGPETNSTRIGALALSGVTTGTYNTAIGSGALELTTTGVGNTAVGAGALYANVAGGSNVAVGFSALTSNVSGNFNAAVGQNALFYSLGSNNVAIGRYAGDTLVNGDNNIYIGADGLETESNATYIGNIHDALSLGGQAVYVNANGKLGTNTITTSARFTEDVAPLGDVSVIIRSLRPVSFHYKPEFDGSRGRRHGLIAEDVANLMPDLVVRDAAGEVQSIRQDVLPTLLVAEMQRLQQQVEEQATAIAELRTLLEELRARRYPD